MANRGNFSAVVSRLRCATVAPAFTCMCRTWSICLVATLAPYMPLLPLKPFSDPRARPGLQHPRPLARGPRRVDVFDCLFQPTPTSSEPAYVVERAFFSPFAPADSTFKNHLLSPHSLTHSQSAVEFVPQVRPILASPMPFANAVAPHVQRLTQAAPLNLSHHPRASLMRLVVAKKTPRF